MTKKTKSKQEIQMTTKEKSRRRARYHNDYINTAIDEAEKTISAYDCLMADAFRKRINETDFSILLRNILNNMNRCFENIKKSYYTNPSIKINRVINILAELNSRLINIPKDYNSACIQGRIITARRNMQKSIESFSKFKKFYADLSKDREESKISDCAFTQTAKNKIASLEEEIVNLLAEITSLNSLFLDKCSREDEELCMGAIKKGIKIKKDDFNKADLANVLEEMRPPVMDKKSALEYEIVIETLKKMTSREIEYFDLKDELKFRILPALRDLTDELSHVVIEGQNVGAVSSDLSNENITDFAMPTRVIETYTVEQKDIQVISDFNERQRQRLFKSVMSLCGLILIEAIAVLIKQSSFEPSIIANFISAFGGTAMLYLIYKHLKEYDEEFHKANDSEQNKNYSIEPKNKNF